MPQRITNVAITLHRKGQRIELTAGKLFDFTAEELSELKALNPDVVRLPRNESPVTIDGESTTIVDDGKKEDVTVVTAAKQAGPAAGSSKKDEKKAAAAGKKEEGSDPADEGEL